MEDDLNIDRGKHVLALFFLNKKLFGMSNETIIRWSQ